MGNATSTEGLQQATDEAQQEVEQQETVGANCLAPMHSLPCAIAYLAVPTGTVLHIHSRAHDQPRGLHLSSAIHECFMANGLGVRA